MSTVTVPPGTPPPAPPIGAGAPLREQPPRRPYEPLRPGSGQPTAAEEALRLLLGVGTTSGAIGAAAPILARLLKSVDWVKVLQAVEEGLRARQERAVYRAVAITWEEFGICTEFVMQLLRDADKLDKDVLDKVIELFKGERPAWYFSPEKKNEICRELLPKLGQVQLVLGRARRHADEGANDEAQKDLEHLAALLRNVRAYFSALTAM
jgi:hypothetical protein